MLKGSTRSASRIADLAIIIRIEIISTLASKARWCDFKAFDTSNALVAINTNGTLAQAIRAFRSIIFIEFNFACAVIGRISIRRSTSQACISIIARGAPKRTCLARCRASIIPEPILARTILALISGQLM